MDAKRLEAIAIFTLEHFESTGRAPSTEQICKAVGYTPPTTRKAWKLLVDAGTIPEHIAECRKTQNRERTHNPGNTNNAHTGACTSETANKLFNLLKYDMEARVVFYELLRGNIRKDL